MNSLKLLPPYGYRMGPYGLEESARNPKYRSPSIVSDGLTGEISFPSDIERLILYSRTDRGGWASRAMRVLNKYFIRGDLDCTKALIIVIRESCLTLNGKQSHFIGRVQDWSAQ